MIRNGYIAVQHVVCYHVMPRGNTRKYIHKKIREIRIYHVRYTSYIVITCIRNPLNKCTRYVPIHVQGSCNMH